MEKAHNDSVLDEMLCNATIAVFTHYGVALARLGPSPALHIRAQDAVGIIGFNGDLLRGTLVIATSTELVERTCPGAGDRAVPPKDRARDWIGEMSNLVLGRIKVAFARRGVALGLSTPVALTGEHIRLGAVKKSRTHAWDFGSPEGKVRAWLEVDFEPGVQLGPEADSPPELAAGDPVLF
jgi:CheY-specific phosphatase CheX